MGGGNTKKSRDGIERRFGMEYIDARFGMEYIDARFGIEYIDTGLRSTNGLRLRRTSPK